MKITCGLIFLCYFLVVITGNRLQKTKVSIEGYGRDIEGVLRTSAWTRKNFVTFHDLRYAEPPVGESRFKPPKPLTDEQDITATEDSSGFPSIKNLDYLRQQVEEYPDDIGGLEDALTLTISTRSRFERRPVLVHLAGYDLEASENIEADPSLIMEKNVVLVSVQYRTGILGFLSTNTEDIPGNMAVLDVIQALKWIKEYISRFGGDSDNVTLFGQYGAAALIHILTMSPLLKGNENENLFHKVIYQSGSALIDGMVTDKNLDMARYVAKQLTCPMKRVHQINKCLRNKDIYTLNRVYAEFRKAHPHFGYFVVGGPSEVLPDWPQKLLDAGKFKKFPTMGGTVKQPAMGLDELTLEDKAFNSSFREISNIFVSYIKDEKRRVAHHKSFPESLLTRTVYRAMWPGKVDLVGLDIKESVGKALKYNADKDDSDNKDDSEESEASEVGTYLYAFNYQGEYSRLPYVDSDLNIVGLTDDNLYLFPRDSTDEHINFNRKDEAVAKLMVDLYVSFATNGKPQVGDLVRWPPMIKGHMGPYLKIDAVCEVGWNYAEQFFVTILGMLK